ncbi:MAG: hypothetical protein FJY80_15650, partial [Candidatus Aminicenantes bacterium]|nr:hypothetical protein [Candidatus Aminicenantes bacterium]
MPVKLRRREFFRLAGAGGLASFFPGRGRRETATGTIQNSLFSITQIPGFPFADSRSPNRHLGVESLLQAMGRAGLKFYRSSSVQGLSGPQGLIAADDVVLV